MANKLQNLIQTSEDINFLVEDDGGMETDYSVSMGQTSNANPSPIGRQNTSSTRTNPDTLVISGWIRELSCDGAILDTTDYLRRLKKTIEAQKYTVAELATITNADGVFLNMALKNLDWRRAANSPQEVIITMTWESMNFSGDIDNPFFTLGGLTA